MGSETLTLLEYAERFERLELELELINKRIQQMEAQKEREA